METKWEQISSSGKISCFLGSTSHQISLKSVQVLLCAFSDLTIQVLKISHNPPKKDKISSTEEFAHFPFWDCKIERLTWKQQSVLVNIVLCWQTWNLNMPLHCHKISSLCPLKSLSSRKTMFLLRTRCLYSQEILLWSQGTIVLLHSHRHTIIQLEPEKVLDVVVQLIFYLLACNFFVHVAHIHQHKWK